MPGRTSIRPEKTENVNVLKAQLLSAPVTALVGVRGVPGAALQKMRRELRDRGHPIRVATNSAIGHALEAATAERASLKPLRDALSDQTALLTATGNPFSLYAEFRKTRSPTPARGGEIAPKDILVPAGTTSFKPGPIVGELQHAGFPAAIEKGKVVLKKDTLIVKAGAPISREVAGLLTRMEIFPLEVGLELRAVVDGATFYPRSALAVDLDELRNSVFSGHRRALGLAVEISYPTAQSIPLLITRAHRRAIALAVEAGINTPATAAAIAARAASDKVPGA
ncbi:MAG: 50S ribosomal protein L10 [Thermoplasmata archaeon]|nr:50S ribosomal protein L10 [Thermoplasmata archaeon]